MSETISLTPSGHWGNSVDNIKVLDNFIEPEDLVLLKNFVTSINTFMSIPGDPWDNRVCSTDMLSKLNPSIHSLLLNKYMKKLQSEIEKWFKVELSMRYPNIVVWRVGNGQAPHADKETPDGVPNMYPENDIASLMYINDNYEGGEIYFPNQNITIKPKEGQAIFFPGDKEYLHGVTTITAGERFTSPAFWQVKKIIGE